MQQNNFNLIKVHETQHKVNIFGHTVKILEILKHAIDFLEPNALDVNKDDDGHRNYLCDNFLPFITNRYKSIQIKNH